jgi:hypothetical protein
MVFCFIQNFFFRKTQELEYLFFLSRKAEFFFPEFNIRLYDKNSESDYFFFLHQNQNIFFSNIGNQNIFLGKKHKERRTKTRLINFYKISNNKMEIPYTDILIPNQ